MSHDRVRLSLPVVLWLSFASPLAAQQSDTVIKNIGAPVHAGIGRLLPELTIGGTDANGDEYIFASIGSVLAAKDGSIWITDGSVRNRKYFVRRYDQAGKFLRNIGRDGDGPGEWRAPSQLAQLRDGRVVLRDAVVGKPLTFYEQNGELDTTWAYKTSTISWMAVDTSDVIWLRISGVVAMRSSSAFATVRVSANGRPIDTLPKLAPLPVSTAATFRVSNARGSTLLDVPYQPRGITAWSPHGYYARAVSSGYVIDLMLPRTLPNGRMRSWRDGDRVVSIRSNGAAVPISAAERADQTRYMNAQADAFGGRKIGRTPTVPAVKPLLRSIAFDLDGRMWVGISQLSERYEPEPPVTPKGRPAPAMIKWREPSVFDVIEPGGVYVGRIAVPYELDLQRGDIIQARGNIVWGVTRDEEGVEAIRRYRLRWPNQ